MGADTRLDKLIELDKIYSNKIPLNELFNIDWVDGDLHCISDIRTSQFPKRDEQFIFRRNPSDGKITKCKKVVLSPTKEQQKILLDMFNGYRIMYNQTNKLIKKMLMKKEKIPSWKTLRTEYLKHIKKKLIDKYKVYSHTLDGAIKLCRAMYESCFTNLKNGNIKYFRVRYLKRHKQSQILDIEHTYLQGSHIFKKYIKDPVNNTEQYNYNAVKRDSKIHYNANTGRFTLLIPQDVKVESSVKTNQYISIDPGIRTFLTGLSDDHVVEIGTNLSNKIQKIHKRLDKYDELSKNEDMRISEEKCQRLVKRLREKLRNKVDDVHWKIINFLGRYDNIVIGNWSTKDIIKRGKSVLNSMCKRIAQSLSFYKFLQRLQYKVGVKKINLLIVDEHYTSKTCSNCGEVNNDLGGSKTFTCSSCKMTLDRDINSTRNMLVKGLK